MLEFSKILYLIPLHSDEHKGNTLFQGYSDGIIKYYKYIYYALSLPASINDFYFHKQECANLAMYGVNYHVIIPFEKELVRHHAFFEHYFTCIISDDSTYSEACDYCSKKDHNVLHITFKDDHCDRSFHANTITTKKIFSFFKKQYFENRKLLDKHTRQVIDRGFQTLRKHPTVNLNKKYHRHNMTVPNIVALSRVKYKLKSSEEPLVGSDSKYVNEILTLCNCIIEIRNRFKRPSRVLCSSIDCILEFPGEFELAPAGGGSLKVTQENSLIIKAYNAFVKIERRKRTYAHHIRAEEFFQHMESNLFQYLIGIRDDELKCYTAALSVLSSNYIAPTIRLSPSIRVIREDLFRLEGCLNARDSGNKQLKLNKILKSIQNRLDDAIDIKLRNLLDQFEKIKIVCDYPLEWMRINNLPLMIAKNTSRLYPVPGNIFIQNAIDSTHINIVPQDLFNITILRSFTANDELRYSLETAIKFYPIEHLNINIIDIADINDLVDQINNLRSNILIFDCHGYYNKKTGCSYLKIGQNDTDLFQLRKLCSLPPIVILSACETFPVIGRHANVANACLACGAISVIATYHSIDGIKSAITISRLLYRIDQYVPLLCNNFDKPTRWLDIVSDIFRMEYIKDFVTYILQYYKIKDQYLHEQILIRANNFINFQQDTWFERIIKDISTAIAVNESDLLKLINSEYLWTDILSYVHVGSPERIIILNSTMQNYIGYTQI